MNALGFLNKHNPGYKCTRDDLVIAKSLIDKSDYEKVLQYLDRGHIVAAYTSSFFDEDGEYLGPYIIRTDGVWIWPSYLSFYAKKYEQIEFPIDFLKCVNDAGELTTVSKEDEMYAQYFLIELTGIKTTGLKFSKGLIELIEKKGSVLYCY